MAEAATHAVHASGRWQRAPDDDRVDAALLLAGVRGALDPEDPRTLATLRAVERELASDGYVYRFRQDERPLERSRAACGPPGLLAEEFDVTQRQLRGNLPQSFAHALLLESAIAQYLA
jgi:GH15 family glucan-1,4-alpha-glucosidase